MPPTPASPRVRCRRGKSNRWSPTFRSWRLAPMKAPPRCRRWSMRGWPNWNRCPNPRPGKPRPGSARRSSNPKRPHRSRRSRHRRPPRCRREPRPKKRCRICPPPTCGGWSRITKRSYRQRMRPRNPHRYSPSRRRRPGARSKPSKCAWKPPRFPRRRHLRKAEKRRERDARTAARRTRGDDSGHQRAHAAAQRHRGRGHHLRRARTDSTVAAVAAGPSVLARLAPAAVLVLDAVRHRRRGRHRDRARGDPEGAAGPSPAAVSGSADAGLSAPDHDLRRPADPQRRRQPAAAGRARTGDGARRSGLHSRPGRDRGTGAAGAGAHCLTARRSALRVDPIRDAGTRHTCRVHGVHSPDSIEARAMSHPDTSGEVSRSGDCPASPRQPVLERIETRDAEVGDGLVVRRALPHRQRRMVGAWCFLDHLGPVDFEAGHGLAVGPHPHIGLQTFTWLIARDGFGITLLTGSAFGEASPVEVFSPLVAMDLAARGGASADVTLEPSFEYAVLVLAGEAGIEGARFAPGALCYLGRGRASLALHTDAAAHLVLIGGEPFGEEILLWWNFVARTPEEMKAATADWNARRRFGTVRGSPSRTLVAPDVSKLRLRASKAG